MIFPPQSQYFADRAQISRDMRDAADNASAAYVHGELAKRYEAAADDARRLDELDSGSMLSNSAR